MIKKEELYDGMLLRLKKEHLNNYPMYKNFILKIYKENGTLVYRTPMSPRTHPAYGADFCYFERALPDIYED